MTAEYKHTPGPWRVVRVGIGTTVFIFANHDSICDLDESQIACRDANARLIAAAPDLLNALEIAYVTILRRRSETDTANATLDIARAAIAKATGKGAV